MPQVDARYWLALSLASVFGTNLGDLYAHESGLGIVGGLPLLVGLALVVFLVERLDRSVHQVYYWLVIVIIRTGATNLADYLAFHVRIPLPLLLGALAATIALLAWRMAATNARSELAANGGLPDTGAAYWTAMLAAGVFGTALGDVCSHAVGQGVASLGLGLLLALVLFARWRGLLAAIGGYWLTVAVARTAGTAIGDWLAENKTLHLGLAPATLLTGAAFVAVLLLWRSGNRAKVAPAFA